MTIKEYKEKRPLIIAVDCDGTLWKKNVKYPLCGAPRYDVICQVKKLIEYGAFIILWTCRAKRDLEPVRKFCKKHDIKYGAINRNYKKFSRGFAYRKIFAHLYIDDQNYSIKNFLKINVEKLFNDFAKAP